MNYSWWVYQTNTEQMVEAVCNRYIDRQFDMLLEWFEEEDRDMLKSEIADLMKRP